MSEIRKAAAPQMPEGYENISEIEEVIREDGSSYYNGIIELGRGENSYQRRIKLEEDDLSSLWGYDTQDYEDYKANPERWEIGALQRRVTELEEENEEQNARIDSLEEQVRNLTNLVNSMIPSRNVAEETATEETSESRPVTEAAPVAGPEPEATTDTTATVVEKEPAPAAEQTETINRTVREETVETVWYRRPLNWIGGLAVAAALVGAAYGVWNHHELEELENKANVENASNNKHEANTNMGDTNSNTNGSNTYFENSHAGGHGLQLDYPRKTQIVKNLDGTYTFKLGDGKRMKLVWNTQGKLTSDTVRALRKENLSVGWANTKFTNREGSTFTHQYSTIS